MSDQDDDRDYRTFYESKWLKPWDLPSGRDPTLIIHHVESQLVKGKKEKEDRCPVIFFKGRDGNSLPKGLICNHGMGATVARLYGKKVRGWRDKPITLYTTTVDAFGETHEVIRIRPSVRKAAPPPGVPAAPELTSPSIADAEFEETPEAVGAAE